MKISDSSIPLCTTSHSVDLNLIPLKASFSFICDLNTLASRSSFSVDSTVEPLLVGSAWVFARERLQGVRAGGHSTVTVYLHLEWSDNRVYMYMHWNGLRMRVYMCGKGLRMRVYMCGKGLRMSLHVWEWFENENLHVWEWSESEGLHAWGSLRIRHVHIDAYIALSSSLSVAGSGG